MGIICISEDNIMFHTIFDNARFKEVLNYLVYNL